MKLLKSHPTGPEDLVSYWQPQYPIIVVTRETHLWEVAIKSACCLHRDRHSGRAMFVLLLHGRIQSGQEERYKGRYFRHQKIHKQDVVIFPAITHAANSFGFRVTPKKEFCRSINSSIGIDLLS